MSDPFQEIDQALGFEEVDAMLAGDQAAPAVDPRAEAARKYAEQAGTGRALGAGLAEGATFGFSDEIQAAIDQLTGAASEPGYLTPQQRTAILKEKAPGAYMGGDIAASLATGLIPFGGQAMLAARAPRIAQMAGKAMPAIQAGLGAVEGAGRGEDIGDVIVGGLLGAASQALPVAGKGAGKAVAGLVGRKTQPALKKKAVESAKELRRVRSTFEPTPEMKSLRSKQKMVSEASEQERQAAQSIFDEPVATMTMERAGELQKGLFDARKALEKASAAEKMAASRAGSMPQQIAGAQQIAMEAQDALTRNKEKLQKYATYGGQVGEFAKKILTAPTIYAISGDSELSPGQAAELALLEAADKDMEPQDIDLMGAVKTIMKAASK